MNRNLSLSDREVADSRISITGCAYHSAASQQLSFTGGGQWDKTFSLYSTEATSELSDCAGKEKVLLIGNYGGKSHRLRVFTQFSDPAHHESKRPHRILGADSD